MSWRKCTTQTNVKTEEMKEKALIVIKLNVKKSEETELSVTMKNETMVIHIMEMDAALNEPLNLDTNELEEVIEAPQLEKYAQMDFLPMQPILNERSTEAMA